MVPKNRLPAIIQTVVFCIADLLLCILCLMGHGFKFEVSNFTRQFDDHFSFLQSTIDFLFLSFARLLFFSTGCTILCVSKNPSVILGWIAHASFSICILFCSFSPMKLLALHENDNKPFFGDWLVLVENIVFSLLGHFLWLSYLKRATSDHDASNYEQLNATTSQDWVDEDEATEELPQTRTGEVIVRLLQYCRDEWLWHISGFTWLFIYSVTRVFVPYYVGQVIASVVTAETDKYEALIAAVKLMVALSVVSAASGGLRGGSFEYAYARINRAVRHNLFTSLVNQDVAFFDKHKTGEITSRLTADTQTMSDTVALNINVFLRNIVQMGGSMIFMLTLCWKLSLVPFIVVPIILVASKIFGVYYDLLSEKTQEAIAHSNDVAEEVLSTMRTVRSFACEDEEVKRFYDKLTFTLFVTKKKAVAYVGFLWVSELFQAVINIAVLWYGGHLVLTNQLQKGFARCILMQLADNIRQLSEVWTGLMQSVGASRKVFQYIDRKPQIPTDGQYVPEKVVGRIQFDSVSFSYPTRRTLPILKNLSFTVEPGEVVALVGPSGSGKSSCIALLEHFYAPTSGRILIDNVPLRDYEHHFIHNAIALVGQEPVLFARSVEENIAYGHSCSKAEIVKSSQMANSHDFIMQTVDQYKTNVGERGAQMSGVAIARALVRNPSILLLDEATSALDTESEHLVQEAIYKNLKGRSVILIAHRLSTVEKADKIIRSCGADGNSRAIAESRRVCSSCVIVCNCSVFRTYKTLVKRQMIQSQVTDPSVARPLPQSSTAGSYNISTSPRSLAQSLLATSFVNSTTSFQSK
ncbi:ATP-binding cassette sub-family B member 9 [Aphelenchoides besseyi]|nr:ATP-binding cassette sub-family B member 9 [Aphelenchoides besseyi]